jgi:hypothetical protein
MRRHHGQTGTTSDARPSARRSRLGAGSVRQRGRGDGPDGRGPPDRQGPDPAVRRRLHRPRRPPSAHRVRKRLGRPASGANGPAADGLRRGLSADDAGQPTRVEYHRNPTHCRGLSETRPPRRAMRRLLQPRRAAAGVHRPRTDAVPRVHSRPAPRRCCRGQAGASPLGLRGPRHAVRGQHDHAVRPEAGHRRPPARPPAGPERQPRDRSGAAAEDGPQGLHAAGRTRLSIRPLRHALPPSARAAAELVPALQGHVQPRPGRHPRLRGGPPTSTVSARVASAWRSRRPRKA